ncbi:IGHM protein, partial [Bucco capensis]|nr:IGHM protein [Bucco capensis]
LWTSSSSLRLPLAEGKSRQPFECQAQHPHGTRRVLVTNPGESRTRPSPPTLSLFPPSREDFQGPYRNSTLLCHLRGPALSAQPISWLRDGRPATREAETQTLQLPNGQWLSESRLVVTESEWDAGVVFSCQSGEEIRNTSKALECG